MTFTFKIFGYVFQISLAKTLRLPIERLKT